MAEQSIVDIERVTQGPVYVEDDKGKRRHGTNVWLAY